MTEQQYQVTGMPCGHRVEHITKEVGVEQVDVGLDAKAVGAGGAPLGDHVIRQAITEAVHSANLG
ncbi:heavy-metal-associated domain-containing protein [Streptomyces sp. NPDC017979]|uniref:heavy-metal-associated domain-containing protein n=1 Tax=Streptomyces sp. NPDC017979 TaxID=3365024 RepID=UPI00378A1629